MFSISFTGFLYQVEFSTRSHLCHRSSSEGGPRHLPELLHKYTPSRQLRSSSDSFTLRVPTTNKKTFGKKGPSPSLGPQSGTVPRLTFAPLLLLLHRHLKHIFSRVTSYPAKSSQCFIPVSYTHLTLPTSP